MEKRAKNRPKKILHAIDKYRKFANGSTTPKGGSQTSQTIERASSSFLIHVNLARFLESIKSGLVMSTSPIRAWATSATFLIQVVKEPTWTRKADDRLTPPLLFSLNDEMELGIKE